QERVRALDDRAGLRAEIVRGDTEVEVGSAHAELAEENVAQRLVVILARVHEALRAVRVERGNHPAEADDLRARAEPRDHFHRSSSRSAGTSSVTSADEYSPRSAGVKSPAARSSGRIGRIT